MKKWFLLFTALSLFWLDVQSQTTVTIGSGTSTGRYPLNDYFVYSRSQALYLSTEINISAGTISALKWYRNDAGANTNAIGTTEIWLKEVSQTTLSGTAWDDPGTLVATISNIDLGSGGAWLEVPITDFLYNGGDLLVSVRTQNAPYTSPHSYWRYTSKTNCFKSGNSDSSNPPTMSLGSSRPNIQIIITEIVPSVLNPTNFTATVASSTQIDLGWNLNDNNDEVMVAWNSTNTFGVPVDGTDYNIDEDIDGNGVVLYVGNATSFEHTGLNTNTQYFYKAWSKNGSSEYSLGTSAGATTPNVAAIPYSEGFATTSTPTDYSITGWTIGSARGVTGNPGNNIYKNFYNYSTTGEFTTIAIGPVSTGMKLFFDYKHSNYASPYASPGVGSGSFNVQISTNYGASYSTIATVNNDASDAWRTLEYDLSAYNGQDVKIKFAGTWISGDYDLAFDNIQVYQPANMSFVSATTTQTNTNTIMSGSTNNLIIGIEVVTTGNLNPITASSFTFNTNGTTDAGDIQAAKLWSSGLSNNFASAVQIGDASITPDGAFIINSGAGLPVTLSQGANYFWLTYDLDVAATPFNVVDAECNSVTVAANPQTPLVQAPAGNRIIKSPLSGVYTIDNTSPTAGTNYNNFTDAINDLNLLGINGIVTFNVIAGQTFIEDCPVLTATGTSSNTITFQKSGIGANPVIKPTGGTGTTDAGMTINGGDYITFNGIDISINSGSAVEFGYYVRNVSSTNGAQYNTIKNCNITLDKSNTSSKGIYQYVAVSPSDANGANSYNTFQNLTVNNSYSGIYISGNSSYYDFNTVVTDNTLENLGISTSIVYGAYFYYQSDLTFSDNIIDAGSATTINGVYVNYCYGNNNLITGNVIRNLTGTSTSSTMYGIYLYPGSSATTQVSDNLIYSLNHKYNVYGLYIGQGLLNNVYNNTIYDIHYSGSSSYIAYGLSSSAGTTNNIYNNYIYDIKAPASTTSPGTRALNLNGGTNVNVFHNTVYIDYTSTISSNQSAALYVTTGPTTIDLRNNIFVNNVDVTTGTRAVAFYKSSSSLSNISANSNNNLYYAGTPSTKNAVYYNSSTTYQSLADYKGHVLNFDQLAVTENPPFISNTNPYDLHFANSTSTLVESSGKEVSTVNVDLDDDIRYGKPGYAGTGLAPDLGADEFEGSNPTWAAVDMGATTLVTPLSTGCYSGSETVTVTIKNFGIQAIDFSVLPTTVNVEVTGAVTQSLNAVVNTGTLVPGATLNVNMSSTLDMLTPGIYSFNASTTVTGDGNATNDAITATNRTVVVAQTLPQNCNFTGFTGSNLTTVFPNWSEATGISLPAGTSSVWANGTLGGTSAKINLFTTTRNDWIVGPKFTASSTTILKYQIAITDWNSSNADSEGMQGTDDKVIVKISTDCGQSFSDLMTHDASNTVAISNSFVQQSINLGAYDGQDIIIAFFASDGPVDNSSDYDFHIDNIEFTDNNLIVSSLTTINSDVTYDNVIIEPLGQLTLDNGFTLSVSGDFTIESDATGTGSFIDYGTLSVTGNTTVQKFLPNTTTTGWTVSIPVQIATGSVFAGADNVWVYNTVGPTLGWESFPGGNLSQMTGYVIRFTGVNKTIKFTGSMNNGPMARNNDLTRSLAPNNFGWNHVGNPYPSPIDWEASSGVTLTNLNNAIYFRSWDGTIASYVNGVGNNNGTNIIPSMQAFWVQVTQGQTTGSLELTNNARVHGDNDTYKASPADVLRLKLSRSGMADETVIRFNGAATAGFDGNFDAAKMYSELSEMPQMYSISNNEEYAINALPSLINNVSVSLGFTTEIAGQHSILVDNTASFDNSVSIVLEDTYDNVFVDLKQQNQYTFNASQGAVNDRFIVHFNLTTTATVQDDAGMFNIYANDNNIYISNVSDNNTIVSIYNVLGQEVVSQNLVANTLNKINTNLVPGQYIVNVIGSSRNTTQKVFLK
ncbi:MAG: BNR-repeat neuraminidase N-terminal domain-containing protein [Bacteroidales bacterium]|nr:BNR-repeat neuraminidase N-terminal domain-containing protein [Bacteroidales bacterium]